MPKGPINLTSAVNYAALKDRNVLVTGAASGIGALAAHMFAKNGANIVIADLNEANGKKVEQELAATGAKAKFVKTDVASLNDQVNLIQQALAFFPRNEIDVYIPNAGILGPPTTITPADPAELANLKEAPADLAVPVIKVNLESVYLGTMLVTRYGMGLHKTGGSPPAVTKAVVLVDSLAGYCGAEASLSYTCAKFGVRGLMRGFRKQAASLGVRVNTICPFYVDTPMTAAAVPALKQAGIPVANLDDVTATIARLATDEDAYGRAISVMPDSISDLGDDSRGMQAGKQFSTEGLGEQWAVLINGPLSDDLFD